MQNLDFDTGVVAYRVNGKGTLRFNPTDPAIYERYSRFADELPGMLRPMDVAAKPQEMLDAAKKLDGEIKRRLGEVFGAENDFDTLLEGVNILAVTDTGATVIENLLNALLPIIQKSADVRQQGIEKRAKSAALAAQKSRAKRTGEGAK